MFKNRFLIVLGVLSLLLVAMVISFPLANTPTSAERGRAADAARWTAMGEYYEKLEESQLERSRAADTARWEAMGEYYANQAAAQRMDSATRSYIAWGEALEAAAKLGESGVCSTTSQENIFAGIPNNLDSATRSYIAWGVALQAKNDIEALCR